MIVERTAAPPGDEGIKDHGNDGHQGPGFIQIQAKQHRREEF